MTDSLSDHLREHCRGWYERVELRHEEATMEGLREALDVPDPPVLTPADLERIYQESLAWRQLSGSGRRGWSFDDLPLVPRSQVRVGHVRVCPGHPHHV